MQSLTTKFIKFTSRNSIPPTTTVENLIAKKNVTKNKLFVDVALWGGVVPGNEDELIPMVENGVVGFKAFLGPSGVSDFQYINETQVEIAMKKLEYTGAVFAVCHVLNVSIILRKNFF